MAADRYEYDLFISYSHADEEWITRELLPRLDAWEVKTCIDRRSFEAGGRLVSDELVRLLQISRQALVVVSRNWKASSFTDLEWQHLARMGGDDDVARVLPLRLDAEELPKELQQYQEIDAPFLGWPSAWRALRQALVAARPERKSSHLGVEIELTKCSGDRHAIGFDYEAALLLANVHPVVEFSFDAVEMAFSLRDLDRDFVGRPQAIRIVLTPERIAQYYSYHGAAYFHSFRGLATMEEAEANVIALKPFQAVKLPPLRLSDAPASAAAKVAVQMSAHLSLAGLAVTDRCKCMLPPLLRLPEADGDGSPVHFTFISERHLPSPSGIFDPIIGNAVMATALAHDPDALLTGVQPSLVTVINMDNDDHFHTCTGWQYFFFSNKLGGVFRIDSADPEWVNLDEIDRGVQRPRSWLTRAMLDLCRIDCDGAYLIARQAGARPAESHFVSLYTAIIDGRWRPLWLLPLQLGESLVSVAADSCEVFVSAGEGLQKANGVIWNT